MGTKTFAQSRKNQDFWPQNGQIWSKICLFGHSGPNIGIFGQFPTKNSQLSLFFTSNSLVWTFLLHYLECPKRADFRLVVFHQKRREWGDTTRRFSKINKPIYTKFFPGMRKREKISRFRFRFRNQVRASASNFALPMFALPLPLPAKKTRDL